MFASLVSIIPAAVIHRPEKICQSQNPKRCDEDSRRNGLEAHEVHSERIASARCGWVWLGCDRSASSGFQERELEWTILQWLGLSCFPRRSLGIRMA